MPRYKPEHCFANAADFSRVRSNFKIVHGTVKFDSGKRGPHAWIETNGDVIDPTASVIISRKAYYAILKAKVKNKFTREEVLRLMIKTKKHGPYTKKEVTTIRKVKHKGTR